MEILEEGNLPPAKRRKLTKTPDSTIGTVGHFSYLTLAHATLHLKEIEIEHRPNSAEPDSSLVSIVSTLRSDSGVSIQIQAPWIKGRATLLTNSASDVDQLIDDCAKIESVLNVQNDPNRAALACHEARLCMDEDGTRLEVKILWHDSSELRDRKSPILLDILTKYDKSYEPRSMAPMLEAWDVREFYDNVHVPEINEENNREIKIDLLQCSLYPFQRRATRWLLNRERVTVQPSGQVEKYSRANSADTKLPLGFHETYDALGKQYFQNSAIGVACSSKDELMSRYSSIRGGLLGEAMGLGKTVEMLALICLHTMDKSPYLESIPNHLRKSKATLIITPPAILEQWRQEIRAHAPSLRVYHYTGVKASSKTDRNAIVEELCDQDVVLTTYNVIAKEFHYVVEKPDRALRSRPRVEPPKSPLDQILWWRVCLDEAQMIESGVSAAATVARLIPRFNSWAVTGTPIKQSHKDLYGLLLFLRYEPWCSSYKNWDYLVSYHRPVFRNLMSEIAIRHSKELVRDELRLPPQSRRTVSMSFTNIEQAHYAQLFYDMYHDLGLNRDGAPANDEWDPNSPKTVEKMRTWLTRLRQTCLHPEVGGRNRRALGRNAGPLRTVAQVLDVMIDQTEGTLRAEQRTMLLYKIRQGQVYENARLRDDALRIYSEAYEEASGVVDLCRTSVEAEVATQIKSGNDRKARNQPGDGDDEESDEEDVDSPLLAARQRLRSALEVKHVCVFFMANIFYQLKSDQEKVLPDGEEFLALEKKETIAYEEAKKIRAELLKEVVRKANKRIANVKAKESQKELVEIPAMDFDLDYTGIESRKIYEKFYKFCEAMNTQAEQMNQLRSVMIKSIQQALIDEDEGVELQGDEYENSTKHQDEMYAYMEILRALYADRNDAVTGQENLLIRSEMKTFLRTAKEGEGPAPEVMIKLLSEREEKRIKIGEQGSLRGIIAELRNLVSTLQWSEAAGHSTRAKAEMHIAEQILQNATQHMTTQTKVLTTLEQEVAHFRNSMNARLEYYKSLQKISDTVAPYREEDVGKPLDQAHLQASVRDEGNARNRCATMQAKSRYLLHLKAESTSEGSERVCTICQSEFETGTITSCGHVFCKEDIQLWYREHGNCPVCKRRLRVADFFDITYKPSEMAVQAEEVHSPPTPTETADRMALSNSIYSDISGKQLNEIKNVDIRGASFGSKVDTICRHLHWLRERDPGCKTLIFSQFREFLDVLARAFRQNQILYSKCDDKSAIENFKSNPAIEVFLLHARAYSAGLNLVVASHVVLCEPLINTAIELQAIARVHRIGQHRATTVWMYLIADTVEESIYNISVKRRLEHLKGKDQPSRSGSQTPLLLQESVIDAANARELQAADLSKALAPGKNGGELVDRDDLWPCLFNNTVRERSKPGFLDDPADAAAVNGEIGRFLRAEAASSRRDGLTLR